MKASSPNIIPVSFDTKKKTSRKALHVVTDDDNISAITDDADYNEAPRDWAEQMAALKLELATSRADCDRAQWRRAQEKQQADVHIEALQQEKHELAVALKQAEKKLLLICMGQTSSSATTISTNQLLDDSTSSVKSDDVSWQHSTIHDTRRSTLQLEADDIEQEAALQELSLEEDALGIVDADVMHPTSAPETRHPIASSSPSQQGTARERVPWWRWGVAGAMYQ